MPHGQLYMPKKIKCRSTPTVLLGPSQPASITSFYEVDGDNGIEMDFHPSFSLFYFFFFFYIFQITNFVGRILHPAKL